MKPTLRRQFRLTTRLTMKRVILMTVLKKSAQLLAFKIFEAYAFEWEVE